MKPFEPLQRGVLRRAFLAEPGAAMQHRREGFEDLAHLRRLVGKQLRRIHVVDDRGIVGLEDQQLAASCFPRSRS